MLEVIRTLRMQKRKPVPGVGDRSGSKGEYVFKNGRVCAVPAAAWIFFFALGVMRRASFLDNARWYGDAVSWKRSC